MPGSHTGSRVAAIVKLTLAVGVAGVLVAALLVPIVGGVGIAARNSVQAFEEQPCEVNAAPPAQRSAIYARDGKTQIATLYQQNRTVVLLRQIPDAARKAVIAIEDRRFYEHHGVDLQGSIRAIIENSRSGGIVQGGSTLTQQYVKQVRLYQAKTDAERKAAVEQTPARKLIEARCALSLEEQLTKDEILSRYLNIAYYGAGAYGIGTAARIYFNKSVSKIDLPQAALLAGLVQSPARFDPYRDPKAAKARRDTVLEEMRKLGYISAKQASAAKATAIKVAPKRPSSKGCANATRRIVNVGFFCQYALEYLASIGIPRSRLEAGGFKIITTIDPRVQNAVQASMPFDAWKNRRAVAVMDVVSPKTGKVLAMGVSRKFGVNKKDRNQTSVLLPIKATAGAGSTYKLFTLVAALQNKVPLRDFTISVKNTYRSNVCKNYGEDGIEPYEVKNAGTYREGAWSLQDATVASVNTFFVALLDQRFNCDLTDSVNAAIRMGLNSFKPYAKDTINGQSASFTLGPSATSPLDLASAYGTIANQGTYCPPTPIERVVGPDNKPVGLPERKCEQRIDPAIANTIAQVLEKDTSTPLGTAYESFVGLAGGNHPIGGKTGTDGADDSDGNAAAWFVGFTPDYAGTVSVINPSSPNKELVDAPGKEGGNVFGAYSASIWRNAMQPILQERTWQFPPEDPRVVHGDSVPVPNVVGQDVRTATAVLQAAGFQVKVSGERKDSPLPPDRIAEQSPSSRGSPGQTVYLYLSSGRPQQGRPDPGDGGGGGGGGRPRPTDPPGND
jgi:membrane peptidoglycan carboxypeptidase